MPACLLMGALLHFFPPDAARDLVAGYVTALAPGSYVVLSVGRGDGDEADAGLRRLLIRRAQHGPTTTRWPTSRASSATSPSSRAGITDARQWHPDPGEEGPFPPRRATRSPARPRWPRRVGY